MAAATGGEGEISPEALERNRVQDAASAAQKSLVASAEKKFSEVEREIRRLEALRAKLLSDRTILLQKLGDIEEQEAKTAVSKQHRKPAPKSYTQQGEEADDEELMENVQSL